MANTNYTILIQQSNTQISVEAPLPDSFAFDVGATYEQMLPQGLTNNSVINITAAALGTRLAVQAFTAQLWAGNTESNLSVEMEFHTETDPVADVRTPIVNLLKLTMPSISSQTGFLSSPGPQLDFALAGSAFVDAFATAGGSIGSLLGGIGGGISQFVTGFENEVKNALGIKPSPGSMTDTSKQTTDGANNSVAAVLQQKPGLGSAKFWNSKVKNKISIRIGNYLYFDSVVVTNVQQTFASNFDAQTGLPHHVRVALAFKPLFMLTQDDLDTLFLNPGSNSTPNSNNPLSFNSGQSGPFGVGANTFNFTG